LPDTLASHIIDRSFNLMPRDSAPTRSAILAASLQTLRGDGLDGFSIAAVAQRAAVPKGLVLYHFRSRQRLLASCGLAIAEERSRRLAAAQAGGSGAANADACWEELRRQNTDGTARAWLALCSADMIDRSTKQTDFEETARQMLLDGCAAAIATGVPLQDVREAFDTGWLALLDLASGP
jgi:AcrR family transcriptional regulator